MPSLPARPQDHIGSSTPQHRAWHPLSFEHNSQIYQWIDLPSTCCRWSFQFSVSRPESQSICASLWGLVHGQWHSMPIYPAWFCRGLCPATWVSSVPHSFSCQLGSLPYFSQNSAVTLSLYCSGANNFMSVGPQVLALLSENLLSPNLGYLFLSFTFLKNKFHI